MISSGTAVRCIISVLLISVLAACATIHLDVDVYKGPLANHEQVQTEQMAVMAVAAKPLLVRLREKLERQNNDAFSTYGYGPKGNDYIADYRFQNADAVAVNAILSLYKNRTDTPQAKWALEASQATASYQRAYDLLKPDGQGKTGEIWKNLSISDSDAQKLAGNLECTAAQDGISELIQHYRKFFNERYKPGKNIIKVSLELGNADCLNKKLKEEFDAIRNANIGSRKGRSWMEDGTISSNAAYRVLADSRLGYLHARLLFPDDQDKQKKFSRAVKNTARAFLDARKSMDRLLTAVLHLLAYQDCRSNRSDTCMQTRERLEALAADLTDVFMWQTIQEGFWDDYELRNAFVNTPKAVHLETVKRIFLSKLRENPYREIQNHQASKSPTSSFLEAIIALRNPGKSRKPEVQKKVKNSRTVDAGWAYGLTRGPVKDETDMNSELGPLKGKELVDSVDNALSGLGTVFHAGRHDLGLETLIEDYIEASHLAEDPGDPALEEARGKLQRSLVRFAEKVRYLADNVGLVDSMEKPQATVLNTQQTRFLFKKELDPFKAVLQAVGNSILIMADEHEFRDDHKRRMDEEWRSEVAALEQNFYLSPGQVLSRIKENIDSEAGQISARIKGIEAEAGKAAGEKKGWENERKQAGKKAAGHAAVLAPKKLSPVVDALETNFPEISINGNRWLEDIVTPLVELLEAHKDGALPNGAFCTHKVLAEHGAKRILDRIEPSLEAVTKLAGESRRVTESEALRTLTDKSAREMVDKSLLPLIKLDMEDKGTVLFALKAAKSRVEVIRLAAGCACDKNEGCPDASTGTSQAGEIKAARDELTALFGTADNSLGQIWVKTVAGGLKQFRDEFGKPAATDLFAGAEKALSPIEKEIRGLDAGINQAVQSIGSLSGRKTKLEKEKQNLETAGRIVSEYQNGWRPQSLDVPVIEALIAEIGQAILGAQTPRKEALTTAKQVLDDRKALFPAVDKPVVAQTDQDPRKVLDKLIKSLNYQYIAAVKAGNKDSEGARKLKQAIEAAHAYRSGMVYIRPASSYLRSSYASTSLQQDPGLRWQNLLGEQGQRNIPLIGPEIYNTNMGMGENSYETIAGIDKQFWQNINRVRVSGAGNTNYAIVKDDIGNWYVKNYEADPAPIIKGAQTLAAFSLGAKMETDLLSRVAAARLGEPFSQGASLSALEKLALHHQSEYLKDARKDLEELYGWLKPIDDDDQVCGTDKPQESLLIRRLATALFNDDDIENKKTEVCGAIRTAAGITLISAAESLKKAKGDAAETKTLASAIQSGGDSTLQDQLKPLLEGVTKSPGDTTGNIALVDQMSAVPGVQENADLKIKVGELKAALGTGEPVRCILDALHDIRRFHNVLLIQMSGISFAAGTAEENTGKNAGKNAKSLISEYLRNFLDKEIRKRQEALKAYEERMSVLGEAAGQR